MNIIKFYAKTKLTIVYPNLDLVCRAVRHDNTLHTAIPPLDMLVLVEEINDNKYIIGELQRPFADWDFAFGSRNLGSFLLTLGKLDYRVSDLLFFKEQTELLTSTLIENKLLDKNVRVTYFRKRNLG